VQNHTTFLIGYDVHHREVSDKDPVPDEILVCRCVMPLGLRQYVPPEANMKYMKALEDLKAVCLGLVEEEEAYQRFITSIDYTNYQDATFQRNEKLPKQKDALEAFIKSCEEKAGRHASSFAQTPLEISTGSVTYVTSYVRPWPNYICQNCLKHGHHFKDACFLFPDETVQKDLTLKWGAQKMKKFVMKQ
jgi:hypothetical protein